MLKLWVKKLENHSQQQENLAESSKQGYVPKRAVLQLMMMMISLQNIHNKTCLFYQNIYKLFKTFLQQVAT
jgi:hypothetical protein